MQQALRPGYFGKVPSQGDFVSSGFGKDLTDRLDEWLRLNVRASQEEMGRGWLDAFLVAPVWKFAIAPGVLSPEAMIGVMMPSVDRVGRYFPLVVGARLGQIPPSLANLCALRPWFEQAEAVARSTLDARFTLATLEEQTQSLGSYAIPPVNGVPQETLCASRWWAGTRPENAATFETMPNPARYHEIFLTPPSQPMAPIAAPGPIAAPVETPVPPTRTLLTVDCAGHSLKGARSRALTETATINPDNQVLSVISGLRDDPSMAHAVANIADLLRTAEEPFSMNDLVASAKGKLGTANTLLRARGIPTGEVFAASVATLLVQAERFSVLWAGNARVYLLRDNTLTLLTRDHSETRIKGMLTRALGATQQLSIDSAIGQACDGDCFLLCSHGLVRALSERDIFDILNTAPNAQQAVTVLTQDAMITGAHLDTTALVAMLHRRH